MSRGLKGPPITKFEINQRTFPFGFGIHSGPYPENSTTQFYIDKPDFKRGIMCFKLAQGRLIGCRKCGQSTGTLVRMNKGEEPAQYEHQGACHIARIKKV